MCTAGWSGETNENGRNVRCSAKAYERRTSDEENPEQVRRLHYFKISKLEDPATM